MKSNSLEFVNYSKKKVRRKNRVKDSSNPSQNEMFAAAANSVVVDAMVSANNTLAKRAWVNPQ